MGSVMAMNSVLRRWEGQGRYRVEKAGEVRGPRGRGHVYTESHVVWEGQVRKAVHRHCVCWSVYTIMSS